MVRVIRGLILTVFTSPSKLSGYLRGGMTKMSQNIYKDNKMSCLSFIDYYHISLSISDRHR